MDFYPDNNLHTGNIQELASLQLWNHPNFGTNPHSTRGINEKNNVFERISSRMEIKVTPS